MFHVWMRVPLLCGLSLSVISCGAINSEPSRLASVAETPQWAGEPGEHVTWLTFAATNARTNARWSPVVQDVVNHEAPRDSNNYQDLVTLAHETSHGIHSYLRNKLNTTGKRVNGFYVLENRAALVEEPGIRKSHIAPFVPASLRGSRYSTYITGASAWDDTPLYVWDEWNGYVNGGDAGVNLVENNLWTDGWRDAVAGQIEFVVYAIASAMAVEQGDHNYFMNNVQFREFLAWNIQRSMTSFKKGQQMTAFRWDVQDNYYEALKSSGDASALRDFSRNFFGADWTLQTLGF